MKFKFTAVSKKDGPEEPEVKVKVYVEQDEDDVNIMMETEDGENIILAYLTPEGCLRRLFLSGEVALKYGLQRDEDGLVKTREV